MESFCYQTAPGSFTDGPKAPEGITCYRSQPIDSHRRRTHPARNHLPQTVSSGICMKECCASGDGGLPPTPELFNQHLWLQRRAPAQQKQPASARARGGAGQPGKDAKLRRRRSSSTRATRRDAARLRDDQQQPQQQQQQQKQRRRQPQGGGGFAASFSKAGAPAKNIVVTLQNDLHRPVVRLLRRPRRTPAGCVIPVCALTHGVLLGRAYARAGRRCRSYGLRCRIRMGTWLALIVCGLHDGLARGSKLCFGLFATEGSD